MLLAAVTVGNILDISNGNTSSVASLIANDGGDGISLREAIVATNNTLGADRITFDTSVFATPQTIFLAQQSLDIQESLIIDATAVAPVTIDAEQQAKVINIVADTGDFTLAGLIITGGRSTGDDSTDISGQNVYRGGGVRSLTSGTLTLDRSTVSGNSTAGVAAVGGGIYARGAVILNQSTVSGNRTAGEDAEGGGISSRTSVTLNESTVSGNSTTGELAFGGGIFSAGSVVLIESTVSGNRTTDDNSAGGGIYSRGTTTLTESTVSGNSTTGYYAGGGGIFSYSAVTLTESTVVNNRVLDQNTNGGGIWNDNDPISITNSIVAGNSAGGGMNDLSPGFGALNVNFSLIGDATGLTLTGTGNIIGDSAELGPLADNGGPTLTHALLPGSPAINAGDPGFTSQSAFDQRGAPFVRVFSGRIDIGAIETQALPISADFDTDGDVDGADFLAWQRGFGTQSSNAEREDGDANNDQRVDSDDLDVFLEQFGTLPTTLPISADFDTDGDIDGADFLAWQRGFGTQSPNAEREDGDANNDQRVDSADLDVFLEQFGTLPTTLTAIRMESSTPSILQREPAESVTRSELIDAAMAWEWLNSETQEEKMVTVHRINKVK